MSQQIKLYVDNSSTTIDGNLRGELYKEFKETLGYVPEDAMWRQKSNPYFKGFVTCVCYSRSYCKCAVKKDGTHFPTGLLSLARDFFDRKGITYEVFDVRDEQISKSAREINFSLSPTIKLPDGTIIPLKLHPYQDDSVTEAVLRQRGILKLCTGAGKTFCAAAIIARIGVGPVVFYVTSADLLKQAADEIEGAVLKDGQRIKVGRVGGGYKTIGDITVMTVQTAVRALGFKYTKSDDEDSDDSTDINDVKEQLATLIRSAKMYFFDECHHVRAETCQIVADNSTSAHWRYGLSATPHRATGDDILIDACFGKTIADVNASFLIDKGYLVRPHIAFVHVKNLKGEKLGPYPNTYKTAVVENPYRNELISGLAQNLAKQGRIVLVLVQQIQHGEMLEELIPGSVFLHGSCSKQQREDHIDLMKKGHAGVTIASTIMDEGMDCKPLNALILAGGGKSPVRALQRIGRVIRTYTYPDGSPKKDAFVYDIYDHQKYLSNHAIARRRIYLTEPAFDVRDVEL